MAISVNGYPLHQGSTSVVIEEIESDVETVCWDRVLCQSGLSSPLGGNTVGVGYIGGYGETIFETYEAGIYLSQLLRGARVYGVHHPDQRFSMWDGSNVIRRILETWNEFFTVYEHGVFIQYFYGAGSSVVRCALDGYTHRNQIVLVGCNPHQRINHHREYYYRSKGDLRSSWQKIKTLPYSPHSIGIFRSDIKDPLFIPGLVHAYYNELGYVPGDLPEATSSISGVNIVLGSPSREEFPLNDETEPLLGPSCDDLRKLTRVTKQAISQLSLANERLMHVTSLVLSMFKAGDYVLLILRGMAVSQKGIFARMRMWLNTTLHHSSLEVVSTQSIVSNFEEESLLILGGFWIVRSICEVVLILADRRKGKKLKVISLSINSSLLLVSLLDCVNNARLLAQGSVLSHLALQGSLCLVDAYTLLREFIMYSFTWIRAYKQGIFLSIVSVGDIEIAQGAQRPFAKVEDAFQRGMQRARILSALGGITLISLLTAIIPVTYDRATEPGISTQLYEISLRAKQVFAIRAIISALLFLFLGYQFSRE